MKYSRTVTSLPRVVLVVTVLCGSCAAPITVPPLGPGDAQLMTSTANSPSTEYRIEPGDGLKINYPYHSELNQEELVQQNGMVNIQALGEAIAVAGLTTREVRRVLVERAAEYLRDPEILVTISHFSEKKVYVSGEVSKPRSVNYRPGLTPFQAISEAGGFMDTARMDSVILIRQGKTQEDYVARKIDMAKVINEGERELLHLSPNDIIFVPKTPIAHANVWVRQYITNLIPIRPPSTRLPVGQ